MLVLGGVCFLFGLTMLYLSEVSLDISSSVRITQFTTWVIAMAIGLIVAVVGWYWFRE